MYNERHVRVISILFATYASAIIVMNVLATKQFDMGPFTVTTGILISPIAFIVQDLMTELFGFRLAQKMIIWGFILLLGATVFYQIAIIIPGSTYWDMQDAFASLLGTTPRLSVASFTAYLVGSLVNAWIMDYLRRHDENKLFFRLLSSTIVGQLLDNGLFALIGFLGILPPIAILSMIVGGTLFETLYEVICYPITRALIRRTRHYLKEDTHAF